MGRGHREEKKSCCTWPRIVALVVTLVVGIFLIWWYKPWEPYIDNVLADAPISGGVEDDSVPATVKPIPTPPPTPPPRYQFMQCNPNSTGQTDCCNGLEGICDLGADEIMYATLHNGMATFEDGFLFGPNHKFPLEGALEAGYRGLNLDICNCGGDIVFCHGICALGPRDVVDVMQGVNEFLDKNPTETIVFIYQVDNDVDLKIDLHQFYDKMLLVDGLVDKLYVHDGPGTAWPTLRQLSQTLKKQIIMFHYNGPDCNADPAACPDGLHQYFNYASDNNWEHLNVGSIEDRLNSCALRTNGINKKEFIGLNNFVSPPSQASAQTLNSYSAATDYVNQCTALLEADINFLLVDFWSEGDLPRFTQDHNTARALQRRTERKLLRSE